MPTSNNRDQKMAVPRAGANAGRRAVMADDAQARDETLVLRFRGGDEDALRILLERHADLVRTRIERWLPAQLQRRLSVSDVMQETRMVVARRCADFEDRGEGSFRRWLLGIAQMKARRAVQHHNAAMRSAVREVTRGRRASTGQFPGNHPSPSEAAIGVELKELARRAIESLSPDYREILRLTREERLTLREAAEHMGRSREATKKLYARALAKVTSEFERLQGGGDG